MDTHTWIDRIISIAECIMYSSHCLLQHDPSRPPAMHSYRHPTAGAPGTLLSPQPRSGAQPWETNPWTRSSQSQAHHSRHSNSTRCRPTDIRRHKYRIKSSPRLGLDYFLPPHFPSSLLTVPPPLHSHNSRRLDTRTPRHRYLTPRDTNHHVLPGTPQLCAACAQPSSCDADGRALPFDCSRSRCR